MKLILPILMLVCIASNAQQANPLYDKQYADSLGANEHGMKRFVLVILKTGPTSIKEKATVDSLFGGHMTNINLMAKAGKLIVAGPIQKNPSNYRGIFILDVPEIAQAEALVQNDPAIKAGLLDADFFIWFGSAALPTYLPNHSRLEKSKP